MPSSARQRLPADVRSTWNYNYVKPREKLDIPIMATEFPAGGLETYPIWLTERATLPLSCMDGPR
jgi:hypothetical protein